MFDELLRGSLRQVLGGCLTSAELPLAPLFVVPFMSNERRPFDDTLLGLMFRRLEMLPRFAEKLCDKRTNQTQKARV
eukprot:8880644-Pyramimonas_sp.AAC.1